MKNWQTLLAVLLTMFIVGLAYLSFWVGLNDRPDTLVIKPLSNAPSNKVSSLVNLDNSAELSAAVSAPAEVKPETDSFPYRLTNTKSPIGKLVRNEKAVLLRNAFIDTSLDTMFEIPESLLAGDNPKTYIAQAKGPVTAAFRRHIAATGGRIISYIPNNAYLVRMEVAGARRLKEWSGTQSVLPFQPYYKLDMKLLEMAITDQPLPVNALLNVVLFPNGEMTAVKHFADLGVDVLSQDRTPFGTKLLARVPAEQLTALARLTEVQGLERYRPRRLANDLTRPRMGVEVFKAEKAADGTVTNVVSEDYLGLNGLGNFVNVNDSGVDDKHAAFGKNKGPPRRVNFTGPQF